MDCAIGKAAGITIDSNDLCKHLWEGHPSGILIVDENGAIRLANSVAEEIFGYTSGELVDEPIEKLIPRRYYHAHKNIRSRYMECPHRRESLNTMGLKGLSKAGEEIDVDIGLSPVETVEGISIIVFVRDMTQQISAEEHNSKLQEQLFRSQKIAALGEITGGMAHDFNNVLATILGYAHLALHHKVGHDKDLENYLNQINTAGNHARDLIKNLMAYSRKEEVNKSALQLEPLIREIMTMLNAVLPKSICTELIVEDELPAVLFDPVQMQQTLTNLCVNARDAMSGKGELTVAVRFREIEEHCCDACNESFSGSYVTLDVTDTGSGIDEVSKSRIFETLFTTKDADKGTGMGLSVVKGITHQNDGHILVDSAIGEGTTFSILLPPAAEDKAAQEN